MCFELAKKRGFTLDDVAESAVPPTPNTWESRAAHPQGFGYSEMPDAVKNASAKDTAAADEIKQCRRALFVPAAENMDEDEANATSDPQPVKYHESTQITDATHCPASADPSWIPTNSIADVGVLLAVWEGNDENSVERDAFFNSRIIGAVSIVHGVLLCILTLACPADFVSNEEASLTRPSGFVLRIEDPRCGRLSYVCSTPV